MPAFKAYNVLSHKRHCIFFCVGNKAASLSNRWHNFSNPWPCAQLHLKLLYPTALPLTMETICAFWRGDIRQHKTVSHWCEIEANIAFLSAITSIRVFPSTTKAWAWVFISRFPLIKVSFWSKSEIENVHVQVGALTIQASVRQCSSQLSSQCKKTGLAHHQRCGFHTARGASCFCWSVRKRMKCWRPSTFCHLQKKIARFWLHERAKIRLERKNYQRSISHAYRLRPRYGSQRDEAKPECLWRLPAEHPRLLKVK